MILENYTKEIFRAECNPSFKALHCIAHLEQNIEEALPYLNASLGGFEYLKNPPAVTFRVHGKLITVHGEKIAVNALKDVEEADKILEWLKREINEAWENRKKIQPSYEGAPKPKVFEVLKMLPKTNCGECRQPTCMVFATLVTQGVKCANDCTPLGENEKRQLEEYMSNFNLED